MTSSVELETIPALCGSPNTANRKPCKYSAGRGTDHPGDGHCKIHDQVEEDLKTYKYFFRGGYTITPEMRDSWRRAGVPEGVLLPGPVPDGCYYDSAKAERAVKFYARILVHTKGKYSGKPFILEPWQANEIIRPLFGMMNPDGTRMYRKALVELPRKNGKSEVAGGIALKLEVDDGEEAAEIYGAAEDREQATTVFDIAARMVRLSNPLERILRVIDSKKRILHDSSGSKYVAIPADAAGAHSFNASGVIFDEIHTQKKRDLWDVLTTSGGTREQPLIFGITTAGFNRHSICYDLHSYARKILKQVITDPSFFAYIRGIPAHDERDPGWWEEDWEDVIEEMLTATTRTDDDGVEIGKEYEVDWRNEKVWHEVNPALGTFRKISEMRDLARQANESPALQNTFRRLYLNEWTTQETRWLDLAAWDRCNYPVIEKELVGEICYGGLDLATVEDLAAWILVFPPDLDEYAEGKGLVQILCRFFVPGDRIAERFERDGVNYKVWVDQKFITATPGNVISFSHIHKQIQADGERFNIKEIAFDRWGAQHISQMLTEDGFTVIPFGQGTKSFSAPTKELLTLVLRQQIAHGGNPVLRWNADNLVVDQDSAGGLKPSKSKSSEKIDGMVGTIMGLDRALRRGDVKSVYETRGIIEL